MLTTFVYCVLFRLPSSAWESIAYMHTIYTHKDEKYTFFHVGDVYLPNTKPPSTTGAACAICMKHTIATGYNTQRARPATEATC